MKRPDGVVAIAVYYALVAFVFLIGSCAVLFGLIAALSRVRSPNAAMWAAFGIGLGLLFCLLFLCGSILAAWGLLTLKNWGRWAAIVLAILQLPAFPIWTAIGGFIIYYLVREDVRAAFDGRPAATAMPGPLPTPEPPAWESIAPMPVATPPTSPVDSATELPPADVEPLPPQEQS